MRKSVTAQYNTLQTELSNRIRKGRFNSIVTGSYNRTDGHRENMEFEQYGSYAKLGYDFNAAWKVWGDVKHHPVQGINPGETDNPYIDNDSASHAAWLHSPSKTIMKEFRRPELLLQLGTP